MPNGIPTDGDYQVIGWLLTVRDEATQVASRAQDSINTIVGNIGSALGKVPDVVDSTFSAMGVMVHRLWRAEIIDKLTAPVDFLEDAFLGLLEKTGRGLARLAGRGFKALGFAVTKLGGLTASAAVRADELVQKYITLDTLSKGFKAAGGIFGMLLGPLGPLLRLFSPVLDMLVDGLMPAVETFTAIAKTAFNPLFELAEVLAQMFAPMVKEFLTPFAETLEVIAVQAAGIVLDLFKGGRATQGISSLFQSMGPVVMEIVKAVGNVVAELLPQFGKIAKEVLPPVIKAFVSILKAVLPIIPPLAKVAALLISKVFGPAVVKGATWFAGWVEKSFVPFIEEWMPAVIILIEDLGKKVTFFFDNFETIWGEFKALVSETVLDPLTDAAMKVWDIFKKIKQAVSEFEFPSLGDIGDFFFGSELGRAPKKMARGGIGLPTPGGREVIVGEAGFAEAIVPLTPEGVRTFVEPIALPSLDAAVGILADIRGLLRGTITVESAQGMDEMKQLSGGSVGLSGVVG